MFDTITETIRAEVKKAKFFAVICDEVQDADSLQNYLCGKICITAKTKLLH